MHLQQVTVKYLTRIVNNLARPLEKQPSDNYPYVSQYEIERI